MIRILHVLGALNRAGAETWLVHILNHIDRSRFQMDFLVHTNGPDDYDASVEKLGSQVIRCRNPHRIWSYPRKLRRILRSHGPYDIVHSHVHKFSGVVLRVAKNAGVPIRLAHSHLDTNVWDDQSYALRHLYDSAMTRLIRTCATGGYGASPNATKALFGEKWVGDPRWRVLFYGIDLLPFRQQCDRFAIRSALGVPKDALVIGHVGRFLPQKNHEFIVRIGAEAVRRDSRIHLLLVGDGPLREQVHASFRAYGLQDHVIFAGVREDVASLMLGAMDVLLFPSLTEGLPLVLLEAQAAGLPCFISNVIAGESDVVPGLIHRLPLQQPASVWADQILEVLHSPPVLPRLEALRMLESSPFDIVNSVQSLEIQYLDSLPTSLAAGHLNGLQYTTTDAASHVRDTQV